jgi:hypothetical protein
VPLPTSLSACILPLFNSLNSYASVIPKPTPFSLAVPHVVLLLQRLKRVACELKTSKKQNVQFVKRVRDVHCQ